MSDKRTIDVDAKIQDLKFCKEFNKEWKEITNQLKQIEKNKSKIKINSIGITSSSRIFI